MKKLLFITTSSLATNPRLVKEFETLKHEYTCSVLCFKHHDWSMDLSEAIKQRNPEVQFHEIDRRLEVLHTVISKLTHKIAIRLNSLFPKNFKICSFASNDKTQQLWSKTQVLKKKHKFIRVIAHNLGSFYPAVQLSIKDDIKLQLDIEDFYPGEALYFNKKRERQNRMLVMSKSFLRADFITYASEGIALECQKQFDIGSQIRHLTILNAFPSDDFEQPFQKQLKPIKCVWFSQNIGPNRGLDQVFEAAKHFHHIEFHLIGNRNQDFLNGYDLTDNIKFHNAMSQEQLHKFLSQMDIGLALENSEADHNRNICLTNKIIAYTQAGLYTVATDTFGQTQFLNSLEFNGGMIINSSLATTLQKLDIDLLNISAKISRWKMAKSLSWENEQFKLKQLLS